jgi:hypothetical protein
MPVCWGNTEERSDRCTGALGDSNGGQPLQSIGQQNLNGRLKYRIHGGLGTRLARLLTGLQGVRGVRGRHGGMRIRKMKDYSYYGDCCL